MSFFTADILATNDRRREKRPGYDYDERGACVGSINGLKVTTKFRMAATERVACSRIACEVEYGNQG